MKLIKLLLVVILVLIAIIVGFLYSVKQDIEETELPANVYEEQGNLNSIINARMVELFFTSYSNEYTVTEEILNLVVLDSIRENINADYDPLSDCETIECNYIVHEDNYYLNYIIINVTEDNQFLVRVSIGSDKFIDYNTVFSFLFDVEIKYSDFEISLTLDEYYVGDRDLPISILDNIFKNLDKDEIENQVSVGELDLEEYSYTISLSPF
jgi:hypothetical protein